MKEYRYIYQQIREDIVSSIKNGTLKQGEKLMSEAQYMQKHNVSRVSIRKAYSALIEEGILETKRGSGTFVALDAFKKIALLTESNLEKGMNIAVILPRMDDFFKDVFKGILSRVDNLNFSYSLYINETYEIEKDIVRTILQTNYDGVIISPNRFRDNYSYKNFERLHLHGLPIVIIGKPPKNFFCDSIYFDDVRATFDAVMDFSSHGYENVFFVTNSSGDVESRNAREEGYRMGLKSFFPKKTPVVFDIRSETFEADLLNALNRSPDRIGIQLYDDTIYPVLYPIIRKCGRTVPRRLGILGYNNYELGEKYKKKLSTIEVPKFFVGYKAVELLERRVFLKSPPEEITHLLYKPYVIHKDTF